MYLGFSAVVQGRKVGVDTGSGRHVGVQVEVTMKTDASAVKGIASRRVQGKVRHFDVSRPWFLDHVFKEEIRLQKVLRTDNRADGHPKRGDAGKQQAQMNGARMAAISSGDHVSPVIDTRGGGEDMTSAIIAAMSISVGQASAQERRSLQHEKDCIRRCSGQPGHMEIKDSLGPDTLSTGIHGTERRHDEPAFGLGTVERVRGGSKEPS